jgi:hypothetical protein
MSVHNTQFYFKGVFLVSKRLSNDGNVPKQFGLLCFIIMLNKHCLQKIFEFSLLLYFLNKVKYAHQLITYNILKKPCILYVIWLIRMKVLGF